ncbi:MAG: DUF4835 family protein [Ignavibacteriae bacterium]|nr:DUF4835 family protein [Ignavibacteriota bacterium]MCB9242104.1 DUF4835 family protein [Ignavibacteriales bacterium]
MKILFITILLFLLMLPAGSFAQDLEATVDVNLEGITNQADRERLNDFKRQVEDYLNRTKYHQNAIPPIKCTFSFNFTGTNGFDQYTAKVILFSQREIYRQNKQDPIEYTVTFRYIDERCTFDYSRSMQFVKNDVIFNSFLSLLDYYAYMIVGFDEDSYYPSGGSRYFQKALDICNKPISGDIKNGWAETGGGSKPSRLQLVQELLNTNFTNFRKGYFEYFWMGLDSLNIQRQNAYSHILNALEKIAAIKKKEVRAYNIDIFFEEKYEEIGKIFLDYGNRSIYDKLIQLDPVHRSYYEEKKKEAR